MILLQTAYHATNVVATVAHRVAVVAPPTPTPVPVPPIHDAQGNAFADLINFADSVRGLVTVLGVTVFFIGAVMAGMLRVMSFGSERRIAVSNMALTAAVVGLAIILGAQGIYFVINTAFHAGGQ